MADTFYICEYPVMISNHQCYIQPIDPAEDEPKKEKKKAKKTKSSEELSKTKPPLSVYSDYEAVMGSEGVQTRSWSMQKPKILMKRGLLW